MKVSEVTTRFNAGHPCPVCGTGSKGCSATADGLHFCRGEPTAPLAWADLSKGKPDAAGFHHFRRKDATPHKPAPNTDLRKKERDWGAEAKQYTTNFNAVARAGLAGKLRLPVEALDAVADIGTNSKGRTFTFPERDPAGRVVGINQRFPDGKKKVLSGGRRGLTLPAGRFDRDGQEFTSPVFVVEGASDVMAMTHAGFC